MSAPFIPGEGNLPKLQLRHASGATAEIYQHGAHVTSWKTPDGNEQLFLSSNTPVKTATPVRGGVPIVFPQFGNFGPLAPHGFARVKNWELAEHRADACTWRLREDAETLAVWPHRFEVLYKVKVDEKSLSLTFTVKNTGENSFSFRSALHTYFRVVDIHKTILKGMKGVGYQDRLTGRNDQVHSEEDFSFTQETDLIVPGAPDKILLLEGNRKLAIGKRGFPDAVIFNPWIKKGASLADLEKDGYLRMVCVEAALVAEPKPLAPSESWNGAQILTIQPS